MQLRYVKVKNVLSFGDEETRLDFGPFNIIAGPNDSGKTNLFRILSIIEKSFGIQKWQLEEIIFQGDLTRPLYLEVGLELNGTEQELLATTIICSEILRIQGQPNSIKEIQEKNKRWKSILTNYGKAILSKSFRDLSLLLHKRELRISEPRMEVLLSQENNVLCIDQTGYISENSRNPRVAYQILFFADVVVDDFNNRFKEFPDSEIELLLKDNDKLLHESPLLTTLFKSKLAGSENKSVYFQNYAFADYYNYLSSEPMLNRLSLLRDIKGIKDDRLYFWGIIGQMYKDAIVTLKELRLFPSKLTYSGTIMDTIEPEVVGTDLAMTLFKLMTTSSRRDKERYSIIKQKFLKLSKLDFQVALRGKEIEVTSDELGVTPPETTSQPEFFPLVYKHQKAKRKLNEAFVQVVKDNYPIPIEDTASGIYEILLLLTAVIGESEKIVLLDEPELHFHPTMQKRILKLILELNTIGRNQIFLITHSPYLTLAEKIDATWRFSATETGTKVHNVGKVLMDLQEVLEKTKKDQIIMKLANPDVRALLFSRGVILVEGPSDKIVVEQIDRFLSESNRGANLDENEWPIIDMGTKSNLASYMMLSQMLGVPSLAILDLDALMHIENNIINFGDKKIQTSVVFFSLWRTGKLNPTILQSLSSEVPEHDWYKTTNLNSFRNLCRENGIFIFSKDLEGVMQSSASKDKPLKALGRILELIKEKNIPSELCDMDKFLKEQTQPI
jgi:AAA15 family ATPase/GTPase